MSSSSARDAELLAVGRRGQAGQLLEQFSKGRSVGIVDIPGNAVDQDEVSRRPKAGRAATRRRWVRGPSGRA